MWVGRAIRGLPDQHGPSQSSDWTLPSLPSASPVPCSKHPPLTSSNSDIASGGNTMLALLWKCLFSPNPLSEAASRVGNLKASGIRCGGRWEGGILRSARGQATHPLPPRH